MERVLVIQERKLAEGEGVVDERKERSSKGYGWDAGGIDVFWDLGEQSRCPQNTDDRRITLSARTEPHTPRPSIRLDLG